MNRLLLIPIVLLALFVGAQKASGAPCSVGNAGGCFHWSDYSRPGTVPVDTNYQVQAGSWQAAVSSRSAYFNNVIANVKVGNQTASSQGNNACNSISNMFVFRHTVCSYSANFTGNCGPAAPNQWQACTDLWTANDFNGNPTNHIVAARVILKDPGVYSNGGTYALTQPLREALVCHELLGHAYGMSHTNGQNGTAIDPGTDSCLFHMVQPNNAVTTLTGAVEGQINSYHGHADPSNDWAGIGVSTPSNPAVASVLQLKKFRTTDGQPYYVAPKGKKAPAGLRSASHLGSFMKETTLNPATFDSFAKLLPKDTCASRAVRGMLAKGRQCGAVLIGKVALGDGTCMYQYRVPNASPSIFSVRQAC